MPVIRKNKLQKGSCYLGLYSSESRDTGNNEIYATKKTLNTIQLANKTV